METKVLQTHVFTQDGSFQHQTQTVSGRGYWYNERMPVLLQALVLYLNSFGNVLNDVNATILNAFIANASTLSGTVSTLSELRGYFAEDGGGNS